MSTQSKASERIFLSHKDVDKEIATKLKQQLEATFAVEVFLSSETIRGGSDWRREIQDAVLAADRLVLLFSDPRLNWDWCLFEVGLFQGGHPENDDYDLVVLLPNGVPPAPLRHLQAIPANHRKVEAWLRTLTLKSDENVNAGVTANVIVDLVQKLAVQYFTPRNLMRVCVPCIVNDAEMCECDVDLATVKFSDGGGALFEKGDDHTFRWSEVADVFSTCNFDADGLWLAARSVRCNRSIAPRPLDLFLAPSNRNGYRPVLIDAELREGNKVTIEFCLVGIPATFRTEASNAFDTLYHVVHLCCRFRWEVVEQCGLEVRRAMEKNQVNRELLGAISRKIQSIFRDSDNRRIDESRVREALNPESRNAIDGIQVKWNELFGHFETQVANGDMTKVHDLLIVMRHLNHAYLAVAVAGLHKLIEEADLPEIDKLDPAYGHLVPARPAPWEYWRAVSVESTAVAEKAGKPPRRPKGGSATHRKG